MLTSTSVPTQIIIFGITGDLSQKKILPALFSLYCEGALPKELAIAGFSRRAFSDAEIRDFIRPLLPEHEKKDAFLALFSYISGDFSAAESYTRLAAHVDTVEQRFMRCSNKLYYLSVSPQYYETIFTHIKSSGLGEPCADDVGWARILVEKPFGYNMESSKNLNTLVDTLFKREQIYRIDHYMAKTSLQRMIDIRMQPDMQERWNNIHIDHIDISLLEQATVENRGEFYDSLGVIYDVIQNHVLQMVALALRSVRTGKHAWDVQKAREEIFESLHVSETQTPYQVQAPYRAQYATYRSHKGVLPQSQTETFVDVTLESNLTLYKGIPIHIRTGKGLAESRTEVAVVWKDGTESVFNTPSSESTEAYKRVLIDCIDGDQSVFTSGTEVVQGWNIAEEIKKKVNETSLHTYMVGENPEK